MLAKLSQQIFDYLMWGDPQLGRRVYSFSQWECVQNPNFLQTYYNSFINWCKKVTHFEEQAYRMWPSKELQEEYLNFAAPVVEDISAPLYQEIELHIKQNTLLKYLLETARPKTQEVDYRIPIRRLNYVAKAIDSQQETHYKKIPVKDALPNLELIAQFISDDLLKNSKDDHALTKAIVDQFIMQFSFQGGDDTRDKISASIIWLNLVGCFPLTHTDYPGKPLDLKTYAMHCLLNAFTKMGKPSDLQTSETQNENAKDKNCLSILIPERVAYNTLLPRQYLYTYKRHLREQLKNQPNPNWVEYNLYFAGRDKDKSNKALLELLDQENVYTANTPDAPTTKNLSYKLYELKQYLQASPQQDAQFKQTPLYKEIELHIKQNTLLKYLLRAAAIHTIEATNSIAEKWLNYVANAIDLQAEIPYKGIPIKKALSSLKLIAQFISDDLLQKSKDDHALTKAIIDQFIMQLSFQGGDDTRDKISAAIIELNLVGCFPLTHKDYPGKQLDLKTYAMHCLLNDFTKMSRHSDLQTSETQNENAKDKNCLSILIPTQEYEIYDDEACNTLFPRRYLYTYKRHLRKKLKNQPTPNWVEYNLYFKDKDAAKSNEILIEVLCQEQVYDAGTPDVTETKDFHYRLYELNKIHIYHNPKPILLKHLQTAFNNSIDYFEPQHINYNLPFYWKKLLQLGAPVNTCDTLGGTALYKLLNSLSAIPAAEFIAKGNEVAAAVQLFLNHNATLNFWSAANKDAEKWFANVEAWPYGVQLTNDKELKQQGIVITDADKIAWTRKLIFLYYGVRISSSNFTSASITCTLTSKLAEKEMPELSYDKLVEELFPEPQAFKRLRGLYLYDTASYHIPMHLYERRLFDFTKQYGAIAAPSAQEKHDNIANKFYNIIEFLRQKHFPFHNKNMYYFLYLCPQHSLGNALYTKLSSFGKSSQLNRPTHIHKWDEEFKNMELTKTPPPKDIIYNRPQDTSLGLIYLNCILNTPNKESAKSDALYYIYSGVKISQAGWFNISQTCQTFAQLLGCEKKGNTIPPTVGPDVVLPAEIWKEILEFVCGWRLPSPSPELLKQVCRLNSAI